MSKIFISYRRLDSQYVTGSIYDRLATQFGSKAIFKDVDNIPPGVDYRAFLRNEITKSRVFLAVIGRNWLKRTSSGKKSPLDDPRDFVRIEIEFALKRRIPIIPILVGGADMPSEHMLTPNVRALAYRNATLVRPAPDFHRDMDRLIDILTGILGKRLKKSPPIGSDTYRRDSNRPRRNQRSRNLSPPKKTKKKTRSIQLQKTSSPKKQKGSSLTPKQNLERLKKLAAAQKLRKTTMAQADLQKKSSPYANPPLVRKKKSGKLTPRDNLLRLQKLAKAQRARKATLSKKISIPKKQTPAQLQKTRNKRKLAITMKRIENLRRLRKLAKARKARKAS